MSEPWDVAIEDMRSPANVVLHTHDTREPTMPPDFSDIWIYSHKSTNTFADGLPWVPFFAMESARGQRIFFFPWAFEQHNASCRANGRGVQTSSACCWCVACVLLRGCNTLPVAKKRATLHLQRSRIILRAGQAAGNQKPKCGYRALGFDGGEYEPTFPD